MQESNSGMTLQCWGKEMEAPPKDMPQVLKFTGVSQEQHYDIQRVTNRITPISWPLGYLSFKTAPISFNCIRTNTDILALLVLSLIMRRVLTLSCRASVSSSKTWLIT